MAKPLPTPENVERATDIIEALQRAVQRRYGEMQEAQCHYDGLCKQGEKLLGDAMLKEFEESAKKAEGARDARLLLQQLYLVYWYFPWKTIWLCLCFCVRCQGE